MGCSSSNNTARIHFARRQQPQKELILKSLKLSVPQSQQKLKIKTKHSVLPKNNSSQNICMKTIKIQPRNKTNNYTKFSKQQLNKNKNKKRSSSMPNIKRKKYNGLVISGDFSRIFDQFVLKDSCESVITKAMSCANESLNKSLTEQQIKVISSLVYNSIKEGKRNQNENTYICRKHIEHPLLNDNYVKMTAKELSQEQLFKDYECVNKDFKEQEVNREKKLKILEIQIL
jgi:hypothetical protein